MKKMVKLIFVAEFCFLLSLSFFSFSQKLKISSAEREKTYRELELFADALAIVQTQYVEPKTPQELIYGALRGLLASLDAYSQFMDPDEYKELVIDTRGKFGGLGIEISIRDGLLTVISPLADTPAWRAGIKAGDIILKIDNHFLSGARDYYRYLKREKTKLWRFRVRRGGKIVSFFCRPLKVGYFIRFGVVSSERVNAAAGEGLVVVTYGLLNFAKNDDELAVVIGHEMAHIAKGHLLKRQGLGLVAALISWGLAQNVPQGGEIGRQLGDIFNAKFSRDFEREADYFGVIFAYLGGFDVKRGIAIWERFAIELPQSLNASLLADHPTTTERLLRVKELAKKLEENTLDFSKVVY